MMCFLSCSDDSKHKNPTGPGGDGDGTHNPPDTSSSTGSWQTLSNRLIFTDTVPIGGCVQDSIPGTFKYNDTTYIRTESMIYLLHGDTALNLTDYDTTRNGSTVVIAKSEVREFKRQGTGTGPAGTWICEALPATVYFTGTSAEDSLSEWKYAVSARDSLTLNSNGKYSWKQIISYSDEPDNRLVDSIYQWIMTYQKYVPSMLVTKTATEITVADTALNGNLVVTLIRKYPSTALRASYSGIGVLYTRPDNTAECQSGDAFSEVLGRFESDLYAAYGKRAAGTAR